MKSVLKTIVGASLTIALAVPLLLYVFQEKLIYHPRPYPSGQFDKVRSHFKERFSVLKYTTSFGPQQAYYISPRAREIPESLWVAYGGNGWLALSWLSFVDSFPSDSTGFLLIDYPGYGANSGEARPESIREGSRAAYQALEDFLALGESVLVERIGTIGFSLGAAAALDFAVQNNLSRVVLVAPFTSTEAMARKGFGSLLSKLLRHRFDNMANLKTLAHQGGDTKVALFHSVDDDVIPVEMGRALAQSVPGMVEYKELKGANHNETMDVARELVYAWMHSNVM